MLSDFFDFAAPGKTKRKVVFFGDPYQIQRTGSEESVLLGSLQKSRELKHQFIELGQLIDTTGGSAKLANAVKLVSAIQHQKFAALELSTDDSFRIVKKQDAARELSDQFAATPNSIWYLAETHSKVNAFTQWIREQLHGTNSLCSLNIGDLLEIYVSPNVHDAFGSRIIFQSGERRAVATVGKRTTYEQGLKWVKNGPVKFHSISCGFHGQHETELEIFEEFLRAEKPELDKETAVAEKAWRANITQTREKALSSTQVVLQGMEMASIPPPATPFIYARYGFGSTVHHAQGMSQPICYVNCDHAAGRHSDGFFRWLYSALTVAERQLVLFNFTDIHPFDKAVWKASSLTVATDIAVGAGWSFQANGIAPERDQQRHYPDGLDRSKNVLISVAIWLRVVNAAERLGWRVVKATGHAYQEQYELFGPQDEQCQLRVTYNGKNIVTAMHVKDPEHWNLLSKLAYECLFMNDYSPEAGALIRSLHARLAPFRWKLVSASETPYRLLTAIVRNQDERIELEINFDKQGLVSSLRPLKCCSSEAAEEIRLALQ